MSTSWATMAGTIRQKFKTAVVDEYDLPTQLPNTDFTKPDPEDRKARWARLQILEGDSRQASIGGATANRYRTPGVMLVSLFCPHGVGDGGLRELADTIAALFRSVTYTGVVFHTPSIVAVGRDGEWYQVNVSCPFHSDS